MEMSMQGLQKFFCVCARTLAFGVGPAVARGQPG